MRLPPIVLEPNHASYDVIIIGGAIMGSSVAWFLSNNPDFDGRVLVVERDPTYEWSSTAHTNSCMRQQFSNEVNIRIAQFAAEFAHNFRVYLGGDPEIPEIPIHSYGYMYLADNEHFATVLRENQKLQHSCGAGTRIMLPDEIAEAYPFYNLDGIILGSHNPIDEGYFDGSTMFDWWRRKARQNGVEYITNEVVAIGRSGDRVENVTLKSGEVVIAKTIVNASGPRASLTARMANLELPVEPRRRYTFIFDAETPLDRDLPLTIDPSGVHMRTDGQHYMCGCPPDDDPAVNHDDFYLDYSIWENKLWPAIATRVPAFETVKVINSWVGHYAYNVLDQNAIVGPHSEVSNFIFVNGFSGHGLQQSPAMGRGVSELITYGEFRKLDMSELGYDRIVRNEPFLERAII
ncbi:MAG: FAD-binding oxidoreductase [Gammaproteobacteria bacterium]|nr:FAD-binding oxidoreductase [Gammaproteobacteria bacterium]MDH3465141.1 FAD-binding oxidoreductase [Gammaproteobacteria bacterium]